jgi:hypothetical protein
MRVYHFICEKYGLENVRKRRLKVAVISALNDPFELLGANLKDKELRRVFQHMKAQMSACSGFLFFSAKWTSPTQWAHYADRHKGLCLGFEIQKRPKTIHYSDTRLTLPKERFLKPEAITEAQRDALFYTKAKCWEYEDERRLVVAFEQCVAENGRYFVPFSDQLALRQVVVGASSTITEPELRSALGDLDEKIEIIKARAAFQSFTITRDKRWPPEWVLPEASIAQYR